MAFIKGKSGNPAGRPKGTDAVSMADRKIMNAMPKIVDSLVDRALNGDIEASAALLNYRMKGAA